MKRNRYITDQALYVASTVTVALGFYGRLVNDLLEVKTLLLFVGMSSYYILGYFLIIGVKRIAGDFVLAYLFAKALLPLASLVWPIALMPERYEFGAVEIALFFMAAVLLFDTNNAIGRILMSVRKRYRIIGKNSTVALPPGTSKEAVNLAIFMGFLYALALV